MLYEVITILTAGSCIGCGICDDICKTDAIRTKTGYDLVHVVFDRITSYNVCYTKLLRSCEIALRGI